MHELGTQAVTESEDAVLAYWCEHRQQIPGSESRRAVVTNCIPVIVATVSGIQVGCGAVMAARYHERPNHHLTHARALTTTPVDLDALIRVKKILTVQLTSKRE